MPEKKNISKQQEKEAKRGTVIYLGPPIPGVVSQGAVFNNGLSASLKEAVEEIPAIQMLIVDVSHTAQARKDLRDKASARAICYAQVIAEMGKKGAHK